MVQKQIKAFNKALKRAEMSGSISNDYYAIISDLIDYERMTKSGYGKAGTKYLTSLSTEELLAYSSDIADAKSLIEISNMSFKFDIEGAKDPKALLWKIYNKLEDSGLQFDSEQVHAVAENNVNINYKDMALQMYKYYTYEDYGLSDVQMWYDSQLALED